MVVRARIDAFTICLAAFYAAVFMQVGMQMLLLPIWLRAKGLDASETAAVLASASVVRIAAIPVLTRLADRWGTFRRTLVVASGGAVLGLSAIGFAQGFAGILAAFVVTSVALSPILPLTDAYALRGLASRGLAYGPVRLWGSVAYVVGNLGAGALIDAVEARKLIWTLVAALGAALASAVTLRPLAADRAPPREPIARHAHSHLRSPQFLTVALAACLIQSSHALYYGFSAIEWSQQGLGGTLIGVLWALGVMAEIVLFAVSSRLPSRIDPWMLIALGAAGAVVRWGLMAVSPTALALAFLQLLHALSFGATFLGSVQLVGRIAGERQFAAAQGDFATISSIGMAAAMAVSGPLYERWGDGGYLVMGLIAVAGGGFALLAIHFRTKERDRRAI
jgi:PPP family 3-phenylpropionic acid transporter